MEQNPQVLPQAPIQDINQPPLVPPKKRKVFPIILTILLLLVLVGAAAFTYLYVQTYTKLNSQLDEITHANINAKPTPTPIQLLIGKPITPVEDMFFNIQVQQL